MIQLEELLKKYGFIERHSASVTKIQDIENKIGFNLPLDYKVYLDKYSKFDDMINCEYVVLWDIDEILELNEGYEIFSTLLNTVAIGGNGGGECIAIEFTEPNNYRVILAPFIGIDETEYHIEIGSSFYDMFARLDAGEDWFR